VNISETCIRRPVMTTLVTASLIVFGFFAYRLLAVAALPAVEFPTVEITATLIGASPEDMAASVAGPIERQLSTIAGITSMTSISSLGRSSIVVQFELNRNIDGAALDVQTALTVAQRRLPIEMTTPPSFRKVNPNDSPILFISLISGTLPIQTVDDYGEITLAQQISQLPGVAQVVVYGAQKFAIRVFVDPIKAAARGLSMEDIRTVVAKANSNTSSGNINGIRQNTALHASSTIMKAADYRDVVAAYRNGIPIKLSEVARVEDSVEQPKVASFFNGDKTVTLAIQKQTSANTVQVVDSVLERLPVYRSQIPASVKMDVMLDRSQSIRDSVKDVQTTLTIAIVLVVLVIFLFLRSLSATIIPSLAVPVSLIATCGAMYLLGYSINNMTMLALTLSVGFVVDDAIVMLENIVRHIEGGMRPYEAALKGSGEVGFTIVSITFSLIAVFIPVLLMGGMVGRVFREFAVTIAVTILLSGFVSLTLTPMLCSRVLKAHHEGEKQNIVLRLFERMFKSWLRAYEVTLDVVLKYRFVTLMITIATLVGTAWLYIAIPKGFFPSEDTGFISATVEARADISFEGMMARQQAIADLIQADPTVDYVSSTVGGGGPNPTQNYGRMFIGLKPRSERKESSTQIIQRLRAKTNNLVGVAAYFQNVQNINITGRSSKSEFQYTMQSSDTDALYRVGPEMLEKISKIQGLRDVTGDLYIKNPSERVEIDRQAAAMYGISVDQIHQELYDCFGGRQIGSIFAPANDYMIIMLCDIWITEGDVTGLNKLYLKTNLNGQATATGAPPAVGSGANGGSSPQGPVIPLSAVAKLIPTVGALQLNHQGQQPAMTVSFNLAPGFSLGQAVDAIKEIENDEHMPGSIVSGFQGSAQVFQDSLKGQGVLVLAAIFASFVILGILYESFVHPITIISGLPSAGIGALLVLIAFGMDLSVIAMIGIVMLVGIVKKNAIMMIDFAIARRSVGLGAEAAIREACRLRFRPIMMTSFAAVFGALPIALGTGAGAELRQPLGVAVVGGLCVSQLLTLYITPVIYLYLDKLDRLLKRQLDPPADLQEEHVLGGPHAVAAE
jgi:HAE1 family hydrophobic/amphiphilic exporter-1